MSEKPETAADRRAKRLAEQLRANLKKRKEQQRARRVSSPEAGGTISADSGDNASKA
jgi:hypothetical protein